MHIVKKLIRYFVDRHLFLIGLAVFFVLLIIISNDRSRLETFTKQRENTEVSGEILFYPTNNLDQRKVIVFSAQHDFRILIYIDRTIDVNKGDYIYCKGELNFANNQYLISQNITAVIFRCDDFEILNKAGGFQHGINELRTNLDIFCRKYLPEPQSSLLLGMLIGSNEVFSEDFDNSLSTSGTKHIIAVSGYNVNFITSLLLMLTIKIKRSKLIVFIIPILLIYSAIVGVENVPALRAIIMNTYLLFGQMLGEKVDFLNSLGLALLIVLVFNPFSALSVSLYLSFLAVISQNLLSPIMKKYIKNESLLTSTVCLLGTLPVSMLFFKEVHPWALLMNVLITPLVPLIMELAIILSPIAILIPEMAKIILIPLESVLLALVDLIAIVELLPLNNIAINTQIAILLTIIIISLILIMYIRKSQYSNEHKS